MVETDQDETGEPSIERTVDEVAQALRAIDRDRGEKRFSRYEYDGLVWCLEDDYEYSPPSEYDDPQFAVTAREIEEHYNALEAARKKAYAQNATTYADGMGFMQTALKWVLGENDAFDHIL